MEKLVKTLAAEMLKKGVAVRDAQIAIGCLDSREHFEKMLKEVEKAERLNRSTVLGLATLIADNEI